MKICRFIGLSVCHSNYRNMRTKIRFLQQDFGLLCMAYKYKMARNETPDTNIWQVENVFHRLAVCSHLTFVFFSTSRDQHQSGQSVKYTMYFMCVIHIPCMQTVESMSLCLCICDTKTLQQRLSNKKPMNEHRCIKFDHYQTQTTEKNTNKAVFEIKMCS